MIIINLRGGLGNQLFQYACGRALSLRNGEPVKFDITGYAKTANSDTPRSYLLSKFNIHDEHIATDQEILALKYPYGILSKLYRRIRTKIGLFNIGFVPRILRKKGNVYLDGYWQTEKYFIDKEDVIRKELSLRYPLSAPAQAMAELIKKNSPSVSLHVRRGDVARDAKTNPYFGITTPEYYSDALNYISRKVAQPHVFVFSDDIEWVKQNIPISLPATYVSGNIPDYEEVTLMSMCEHNIIANSSFSWWGAWLNRNRGKIVIAPKEWIKKRKLQHKDITPSSWTRI
jgi:hypothetical protein